MGTKESRFPIEFDSKIYREKNPDLNFMTDEQLLEHFKNHGSSEGRVAGTIASRDDFVSLISLEAKCLEIGPFDAPCIIGPNIDYLDLLSQSELQTRAAEIGRVPENVPSIKWVAKNGRLDVVSEMYDVLFSCHNIEHQFDLVDHLKQAERVLNTGGYYFMVVPDSRYCFDHFISPSNIAEVIEAFEQKRQKHSLQAVIEHRALTTHNDPVRHWAGDHGLIQTEPSIIKSAIAEFHGTEEILDVHAWQFTPDSFAEIMSALHELQVSAFEIIRVYPTLRNNFEFMAILQKK